MPASRVCTRALVVAAAVAMSAGVAGASDASEPPAARTPRGHWEYLFGSLSLPGAWSPGARPFVVGLGAGGTLGGVPFPLDAAVSVGIDGTGGSAPKPLSDGSEVMELSAGVGSLWASRSRGAHAYVGLGPTLARAAYTPADGGGQQSGWSPGAYGRWGFAVLPVRGVRIGGELRYVIGPRFHLHGRRLDLRGVTISVLIGGLIEPRPPQDPPVDRGVESGASATAAGGRPGPGAPL